MSKPTSASKTTLPTLLVSLWALAAPAAAGVSVTVVTDPALGPPARYGLAKLEAALRAKGVAVHGAQRLSAAQSDIVVLAGLCSSGGPAAAALKVENVRCPETPESLVIRRTEARGRPALLLCGSDARGLMYAALDTARRVAWSEAPDAPFACVRNTAEQPFIRERAVSLYTMQRAWFESRLYDEAHWRRYFDTLAASRINSFVVIFGYENGGFMAPPYPYFFDVEGFPEVELVGHSPQQQERNVAAFRTMIRIAHERGIDVTAAIWDHIYRGGVQGGGIAGASERAGRRTPGLVWGLTAENLSAYSKAAVRKFLEVFPDIDALQFRMHGESGLKREEMPGFWHEIFTMIKQMRPDMRVDLRAKELPDSIIADALDQGLKARVATKYWMEQMGLPFHPTHVNRQNQHDRRHGYADLMRYPQRYRIHWRLWNGGATRLLLWGDPDYVRRFAASARLYDGDSLEVNEMLATKMLAEPHDRPPLEILNPRYRYYNDEFERYWYFFQLWGRLSYNPNTPAEIWEREFERRFGPAGSHLMHGLHFASRVLPRIVAASYRYRLFPTTRGWAEMTRMGDLPEYAADEEPSDIRQFMNVREEARLILEGADTAMRRPTEISAWFARTADEILHYVRLAEDSIAGHRSNEYISTVTDLKILAGLARYHSQRLLAAVRYNLYKETGDLFAFDDAIEHERNAVSAWRQIVDAAGDVYHDYLAFGVHDKGFPRHWNEELEKLHRGLEELQSRRRQARASPEGSAPRIAHVPVRRLGLHEPLRVRATAASAAPLKYVRLLLAREGDDLKPIPMVRTGDGMYQAELAPSGAECEVRYLIEAEDEAGKRAVQPPGGPAKPFVVLVTDDRQPPRVSLERAVTATPGAPLMVTARVADRSGIRSVRLRYRHATQFEDYETAEMVLNPVTGLYEASIPGAFIVPEWDLMYFLEAVDRKGNGRIYPDLESDMPYVIVKLKR